MQLAENVELDNLSDKNKTLNLFGNSETRKFLLHILLKAQIDWTTNSSAFGAIRSAYYTVAFWHSNEPEDVAKFNPVQINAKLLELEPHFIENPCVVEDMPLADFTSLDMLTNADDRIIKKLQRLNKEEIIQLKHYADTKIPVAQLLMYFIAMGNGNKNDAKAYLIASAEHYPLANFFLSRNTLYGNDRCDIEKNTAQAIAGIDLLTKSKEFYPALCTLLLYRAMCKKVVKADQFNNRLLKLVIILIKDMQRKYDDCVAVRGATGPKDLKLSGQIIALNERLLFEAEEKTATPVSSPRK